MGRSLLYHGKSHLASTSPLMHNTGERLVEFGSDVGLGFLQRIDSM